MMPEILQKPVPKPRNHERIANEFLAKTPDELAADQIIEDKIEELLSYNFLAKYDNTSLDKIYSQIREVEKRLGNTVNSDRLFSITIADDSRDFSKQWAALFNRDEQLVLNDTITEFILQKNNFLGKKIREFREDIKGFCLSFTNAIDLWKLRDKKDFDYLLSLADCNENELSNENFEKFLNGELHLELLEETNEERREKKQKLIDLFSLIRYMVEEAVTLQASNINIEKNSQFSLQLDRYRTTRSFDPKKVRIVLNRSKIKQALQDLPEVHTMILGTN